MTMRFVLFLCLVAVHVAMRANDETRKLAAPGKGEPCYCELIPLKQQPEGCCAKGLECAKVPGRGARCRTSKTSTFKTPTKGGVCACAHMDEWEQPVGCCETGYACTNVTGRGPRCTRSCWIDQAKGQPCQIPCGDLPWNEQPARCCAEGLMCNDEIHGNSYVYRCRPHIQAKCRRKWSESIDNTECGHRLVSDSKVLCGKKKRCCIPSAGTYSNKSQHVAFGPADQPVEASCCSGKAKPRDVGGVEKMVCVD
mmetsp:Transcript_85383/g.135333  ORF Transcript_85383/g.135333 Transcript_85383/m.135333 type:complete len:253 (+) Transcript_85383:63-821(+)